MLNPFFNTAQYPWQLHLAQELYDELVKACLLQKAQLLVETAGIQLAAINWVGPMQQIWSDILNTAVRHGLLETLLDRVLKDDGLTAIHGVVQRVKSSGHTTALDVCDQLVLPGDLPFLNRDRLRKALRRMRENSVRSILLVRGQPQSGKTVTLDLVTEVAKASGDDVVYLHEAIAAKVDKIVSILLKRLGAGPATAPPQDTTDPAWYTQVGLEALERASKANRRWWIIVDNLGPDVNGQPQMDREVLALFHQFALMMADPGFSRYFRLVLLDYPSGPNHPPSKLKKNLLEEDETCPLSPADIGAFVKAVLDSRKRQYSEADLQKLTQDLVQKADAQHAREPESGHMAAIHTALAAWLVEIRP